MARVAMVGAGSVVFANNILGDLLTYPELKDDLEISLHDIDPLRLKVSEGYALRRIEAEGAGARVVASADLKKTLAGADYVINMVQVGGFKATLTDFNIPAKYGLRQTIADTNGVGGIFRALRTIPVVMDICRQMEKYCPEALFINYSNPMAMNVWAAYRASGIKTVGLCHSIQLTSIMLANYMDIPIGELSYRAAGINHICWFLELAHRGRDVYPLLFEKMEAPLVYSSDRVRFEIMKHFGYFVSESSEHMAEYVPYFITRDDLIERLQIPINEYLRRCEEQDLEFAKNEEIAAGSRELPLHYRTLEYAAPIINAIETNQPALIYGNVENTGVVNNLPYGCCVEVPCLIDASGIAPVHSGELPSQLAAINRNHINVQELTVKAVLEKEAEYVYYACRLDPLAAAVLTLDQIDSLVQELWAAHEPHLSYF